MEFVKQIFKPVIRTALPQAKILYARVFYVYRNSFALPKLLNEFMNKSLVKYMVTGRNLKLTKLKFSNIQ